jgi:hypothetical protein
LFKPRISDRDYFVWELKSEKGFNEAPVTYSRGLSWLKAFMLRGISEARTLKLVEVNEMDELEKIVREVTWHSMRVTMLSEAVKAQVDDKIVGLQANCMERSQPVGLEICSTAQRAVSCHGQEHDREAQAILGA